MNRDNVPISAGISLESIGFSAFSKVYLRLVDKLIKRNIDPQSACTLAIELVSNYFNFINNSKFAEMGGVAVDISEEEN